MILYRELLLAIRLSVWFACFWAIAGTFWRPPLTTLALTLFFLAIVFAVEWFSQTFQTKTGKAKTCLLKRLQTKTTTPNNTKIPQTQPLLQNTRSKTPEGLDRLEGTFWADFPDGAKTVTVHIPFCPAFSQVPKLQIFPVDEPEANVRIVQAKPHGIRVDVKRSHLDSSRLCFAFEATADGNPTGNEPEAG